MQDGKATLTATSPTGQPLTEVHPVDHLVVVQTFGQPVFPGLKSLDHIINGTPGQRHHVAIDGENFHVLETLLYTHEEAVDFIYIDPPYNTGKDTFIYNDRYVDASDDYRHSVWLSFMERRLQLARRLLKSSGLIFISIDDTQQARLKLLCDQVFGEANFIASMIWKSKSGGANDSGLAVDHEYILAYRKTSEGQILPDPAGTATTSYNHVDENGRYALERLDKQNLSYSASLDYDLTGPDGTIYTLNHKDPSKPNANWRWSKETVANNMEFLVFENGCVYTKNYEKDQYGARSLLIDERFGRTRTGGSNLSKALGRTKQFDYPKPVKLIEYLLSIATGPDAVVLDFFAGSGTTLEAVMSLNAKDGGCRQCLLITNNELSKAASKKLSKEGIQPGTEVWEDEGIFRRVTKPRIIAAVTGRTPDGDKFSEGYKANLSTFDLVYQDKDRVTLGKAFATISGLLWLKSGAAGPMCTAIDDKGWWAPPESQYTILFDIRRWKDLTAAVSQRQNLQWAYIVTDSQAAYQQIVADLPPGTRTAMLYEDYLTNFEINTTGGQA